MISFKVVSLAFIAFPVIIAASIPGVINALDKATAVQCIQHDWPAAAHQVHMDWCADNGYKTN